MGGGEVEMASMMLWSPKGNAYFRVALIGLITISWPALHASTQSHSSTATSSFSPHVVFFSLDRRASNSSHPLHVGQVLSNLYAVVLTSSVRADRRTAYEERKAANR